jgi:hypothetical protein
MPSDGNSSYRWAKNCSVCRSWQAEHVCSLNLTSISYSFLNKGQKKDTNSKIGNKINLLKNCRVGRSRHVAYFCNYT